MTLPGSGAMAAALINVELGRASTAPFDINGAAERALAGVPTGAISFADFYGKSASSFTASAAPSDLLKTASTSTIVTDFPAVATPTGGTGPFTYQWYVVNNTGNRTVTIDSGTSQSTYFRISAPLTGDTGICDAFCVITDTSNAETRNTNYVSIYLERGS